VTGEYGDPEYEALFVCISENIRDLADTAALTIAQFSTDGLVTWEIRRDEAGTPRARYWPAVPWSDLRDGDVISERELSRIAWPEDGSRLVLVCSAPDDPSARSAFQLLLDAHRGQPAFRCTVPLDELFRRVIAADPLTQWYELVTLRRAPSGRLVLTGTQLFPPGTYRGERQSFTIHCQPSDEDGTVFAVVATETVDKVRLVSLDSASLPPGIYNLTAVLRRPGLVRFEGLPTKLREEHRSWPEIIAGIPERLDVSQPAHLICAVEVSGPAKLVGERIELTGQLIRHAAAGAEDRLKFSLVTYGPHAVGRSFPEVPTQILAWAEDRATVLAELGRVKDHGAAPTGYPRAAQLECVLAQVAGKLDEGAADDGRPVVVTIGSRPAFPDRLDPVTEIIPCPEHNDWRRSLQQLQDRWPGIAFGAISDSPPDQDVWPHLASGAFAPMSNRIFDVQSFAEDLGLLSRIEYIPLPLTEPEGS
jgi:hypothetical protein